MASLTSCPAAASRARSVWEDDPPGNRCTAADKRCRPDPDRGHHNQRRNTNQINRVRRLTPAQTGDPSDVINTANHADHRCGWIGWSVPSGRRSRCRGDVAARHRRVQSPAGIGNPPTGHGQLPEALGCFRRWKVEVVGHGQGSAPTQLRLRAASATAAWEPVQGQGQPIGAVHRGRHTPLCTGQGPSPCWGLSRTTAASAAPDDTTVLASTCWSYCR